MNTVRLGLIGCGPRGISVVRTFAALEDATVTAVCDRFEARTLQACAAINGHDVQRFTDHQQMLREAAIDAVLVVVEPENAPSISIDVLESGRHVYSEVPMGLSLEDCWRLVLAVERTGLKYQLAEQVRHLPFIRAWRNLVREGTLGTIVHAEGQYLHGMGDDRYWLDAQSGARISISQAADHPHKIRSRFWTLTHPILYLPHELSPLLYAMDDRVVSVVGMSTGSPSKVHPWFPNPDFEVAMMKTEKGAILRLCVGFTIQQPRRKKLGCHWYSMIGTQGSVETNRVDGEPMKLWLPQGPDARMQPMVWEFDSNTTPQIALQSGHGGADYWPARGFIDALAKDQPVEMDVYTAVESAAPAILAAQSIQENSRLIPVPCFRRGSHRAAGQRGNGSASP